MAMSLYHLFLLKIDFFYLIFSITRIAVSKSSLKLQIQNKYLE